MAKRNTEKELMLKNNNNPSLRLEIIEDVIRKKYLSRLSEMHVVPADNLLPLRSDAIRNIRLFRITEMVYPKGEIAVDKFYTVFSTLAPFRVSVFIVVDSDGKKTDFYIGVRNNEKEDAQKKTTVMFGNMLKDTLIGQFPGIKIEPVDRNGIIPLSDKIASQHNISSVSVVASSKSPKEQTNEQFIQGLEKLVLAMQGKKYTGIIIAENQAPEDIQFIRRNYQELYTKISPFQKVQVSSGNQISWSQSFTDSLTVGKSRSLSFGEMDGKQKAAAIGGALLSVAGVIGGALLAPAKVEPVAGAMIGGQMMGSLASFVNSLAPNEQISESRSQTETITKSASESNTVSTTRENRMVTDLMELIDSALKRIKDFDSYGMWNVAGYFSSHAMSVAEIAASNYRSLMSGENSSQVLSAVNAWWKTSSESEGSEAIRMAVHLSRFTHPLFRYGNEELALPSNATTWVSGKELGLHLGFPRSSIPGMPVTEHAEFGKEVYRYQTLNKEEMVSPKNRMTLGKVFDLGQATDKGVELDNRSLNMHTFITGSTGSGKSNTVYQMLRELYQDEIPFLVIEPAKGEYKDVFGNWSEVNVYSTNPKIAELIKLNPFKFPYKSIHILEHIDGLVEIFSVCWPMYDAMPAFFKDAILKSYEAVGWDLGSSTFDGEELEYPDFDIVVEQLNQLIEHSDYASDIKSNYRGALITRVKSLTVGLNRYVFTSEQTPYEKLFDEYCILDISRVKSNETKALLMGLMVYMLNEYRLDQRTTKNIENDSGLKHITVLEEAHNLLKNTTGNDSNLIGKSVEMLAQTIAEIRTYGEGFIIVDQSPSSVDISAIKNTNTKIVLRTPEKSDREAVGRSMGLSDDQVNEIARLPGGVAVVYQNDWVNPVLTMINKADVDQESYKYDGTQPIMTVNAAREYLIRMLMRQWVGGPLVPRHSLRESLKVMDLPRKDKILVTSLIDDYSLCGGNLNWDEKRMPALVLSILGINLKEVETIQDADTLEELIASRLKYFRKKKLQVIYDVLKRALTGSVNS